MSKTWALIALFLQFILIVFFYQLFKNEPSDTQDQSRIDTPLQELTKSKLLQLQTKEINWKEFPRKPSPSKEEMHEKWIVVTTINSPTADVKKLAGIEGWRVVVVGDTKTPADWRYI